MGTGNVMGTSELRKHLQHLKEQQTSSETKNNEGLVGRFDGLKNWVTTVSIKSDIQSAIPLQETIEAQITLRKFVSEREAQIVNLGPESRPFTMDAYIITLEHIVMAFIEAI
jgi:hypothetical protein